MFISFFFNREGRCAFMGLYQELLALNQNINRFERYLFKQYPISNTEYLILITLSAKKTATSSQLAEALNISKPTISHHIKKSY